MKCSCFDHVAASHRYTQSDECASRQPPARPSRGRPLASENIIGSRFTSVEPLCTNTFRKRTCVLCYIFNHVHVHKLHGFGIVHTWWCASVAINFVIGVKFYCWNATLTTNRLACLDKATHACPRMVRLDWTKLAAWHCGCWVFSVAIKPSAFSRPEI